MVKNLPLSQLNRGSCNRSDDVPQVIFGSTGASFLSNLPSKDKEDPPALDAAPLKVFFRLPSCPELLFLCIWLHTAIG